MLIIVTMVFVLVAYLLKVEPIIFCWSYIIATSALKGILCKELRDVFNLRPSAYIYKNTGLLDSIISFGSLVIIQLYYLFVNSIEFTLINTLAFILPFIILYRFIYWNIATVFKEIYTKK